MAAPADVLLNEQQNDTGTGTSGMVMPTHPIPMAGIYQRRSGAAYWDGRNEMGERVANIVYFYTLSAGEFSATRKLLIKK